MLRLFRQYYPIRNIFFFLGEGVFIYASVWAAAMITKGPAALLAEPFFYARLFLITVVCQVCLYYNELYDLTVAGGPKELGVRLVQSLGAAGIFLALIYLAFPAAVIGSVVFMAGTGIVVVLVACWRFGYSLVLSRGLFNQRIILLGSGELVGRIRAEIDARRDCGYTVAMEVPESVEFLGPERPAELSLICRHKFEGLCEMSRGLGIEKIVVGFREKRSALPMQELLRCRVDGIEVIEGNSFYEMLTGKLLVESINPSWLIFSEGFQKSWMRRSLKRSIDLSLAAVLLVLLLPLFLLAAAAVRLDSPGPVFYSQQRVGERRRIYRMHKFRSMVQDAEKLSGPIWADPDDPRTTRVGRFLRRFRVDELPQLWNVLKGEMSFVGPRPEREAFVQELERLVPFYRERFSVKPGITGWAQVNYGYGASVRDAVEKLNYDLFYIKNMTLLMDLLVMLRTIKILIFGYGVR
ncbi:MAG: TIGR03013 family PEP-CTERM/XrtA system glycosyltransferase [Desulfobacterales bacterium]|jgi:sugar transferase (PEP-CTERM system associated)|nr:TIGR03013 family PEP-CTERM/XrtA system glycosyltransferase [Desulfobacterales bacterium]